MQTVSNLFLLVCAGLTALLFALASDMDRLAGPDKGGAEIQFLMVVVPRWLLMAVVLGGLVARGAFGWVSPSRRVQWIVVSGAHIIGGAVSAVALMAHGERSIGPLISRYSWMVFSAGVPIVVILYAAVLSNPKLAPGASGFLRLAAVAAVAMSTVAGLVALGWNIKSSAAQAREFDQAAYQKDLSELDQVGAGAPLERYFDFTLADNRAKGIKDLAIQRMQARPDYVAGLAALLRGPQSSYALTFLRYGLDQIPPVFAEPARDAVLRNAGIIRERQTAGGEMQPTTFDFECMQSLDVIEKLRNSGVDFVPAVRELKAAMDSAPNKGVGAQGRAAVEQWLQQHAR